MTYAIKNTEGKWIELQVSQPLIVDDIATSYDSILLWSSQYRTAQGVKVIKETDVPEGKYVINQAIEDQDDKPVYVYQYGDIDSTASTPQEVTMRQARAILIEYEMDEQVETLISGMPDKEGKLARNDWEYAATIRRDHPLILYMISELGLSEAQVDQMFTQASQLS